MRVINPEKFSLFFHILTAISSKIDSNIFLIKMFELKVKKKTLESAYFTRSSRILWMELMMGLEPMTSALPSFEYLR